MRNQIWRRRWVRANQGTTLSFLPLIIIIRFSTTGNNPGFCWMFPAQHWEFQHGSRNTFAWKYAVTVHFCLWQNQDQSFQIGRSQLFFSRVKRAQGRLIFFECKITLREAFPHSSPILLIFASSYGNSGLGFFHLSDWLLPGNRFKRSWKNVIFFATHPKLFVKMV